MRISGWHVEKFGCLSNQRVDNLPEGLVVVFGPNEGGKSTLHAFIRGVLFGFPPRGSRSERRLVHDGASIGRLYVEVNGTSYTVERKNMAKSPVVVRGSDGAEGNEVLLRKLLNDADASVFRSIFAFGLGELQDFASLNEEQVRDKLFAAAMGTGHMSPTKAVANLDAAATEFYKERGSTSSQSLIRSLIQQAQELEIRLTTSREQARGYPALEIEELVVLDELKTQRLTEHDLMETQRVCVALVELFPLLDDLAHHRTALDRLPVVPPFAADAAQRLAGSTTLVNEATAAFQAAEEECLRIRAEIARTIVDVPLLQAGIALDPVLEELPLQRERVQRLQDSHYQLAMARQQLAAQIERLGNGWTEERLASWSRSALKRSEIQDWQNRLESVGTSLSAAAHAVKTTRDALAERERERTAHVLSLPKAEPMSRAELGQRETDLQRLRALRDAERDLQSELRDCDARLREVEQRSGGRASPPLRAYLLGASIAIVAAGGSAVAALRVLTVAVLAVALILIIVVILKRATILADGDPAIGRARERREQAALRLDDARSALAGAAATLGISTAASSEELATMAVHLTGQRELRTEYDQRLRQVQVAEGLVERERARAQEAESALRAAELGKNDTDHQWALAAEQMGLPAVRPASALSLMEVADGAKDLLERCRNQHATFERDRSLSDAWTERTRVALARAQGPDAQTGDVSLMEVLGRIAATLSDQREAARRREDAEARLADAEVRFDLAKRREREAQQRLSELLAEADCSTEGQFLERLEVSTSRAALHSEMASVEQRLQAALRMLPDPEMARQELSTGSPAVWRDRSDAIQGDLEAASAQRDECAKRLNQLAERKKKLHTDSQIAALDLERSSLIARIHAAGREWLALRVAAELIRRTKEEYERKRQPGVIAAATPLFELVTRGRYTQIRQREEDSGLELVASDGSRWRETDLSQGTQEQLFLSLRLALAQEFGQGKSPLPLIMDDVLVNFDPERAAAVGAVLRKVAETRQVIVLTCHPWVRDVLVPEKNDFRVISLGYSGPRGPELLGDGQQIATA